ncbi:hypothetical protein EDB87DRAFT_1579605 [Lactarius vividus]|nr:hypothetical protein EDB87DRAFT_1579605 [Lactarius vividus]
MCLKFTGLRLVLRAMDCHEHLLILFLGGACKGACTQFELDPTLDFPEDTVEDSHLTRFEARAFPNYPIQKVKCRLKNLNPALNVQYCSIFRAPLATITREERLRGLSGGFKASRLPWMAGVKQICKKTAVYSLRLGSNICD